MNKKSNIMENLIKFDTLTVVGSTKEEALEITPEQYQYLMQGLEIVARHPIQEVRPDKIL